MVIQCKEDGEWKSSGWYLFKVLERRSAQLDGMATAKNVRWNETISN